jgi:Holliday junction resolvasome RuvABC DNA-binding subunit
MIAHINGILDTKAPARAIIDAGGIGCVMHVPAPTYVALPETEDRVRLHTHTEGRTRICGVGSQAQRNLSFSALRYFMWVKWG